MARITRFDHTSLTVADIDRTVAFWRDVMGLTLDDLSPRTQPWLGQVVGSPGATCRIAHMSGHGCHMEFIAYDDGFAGDSVFGAATRPGAAHVAFFTDDLAGMVSRILAAGGSMVGAVTFCAAQGHNTDCLAAYVADPEGIILDLIEDRPAGGHRAPGGLTRSDPPTGPRPGPPPLPTIKETGIVTNAISIVPTTQGSRYLQQLCKHWAHNLAVDYTPTQGKVIFPPKGRAGDWPGEATLLLQAADDHLSCQLLTSAPEQLEALKGVVESHLDRFAFREAPLTFDWREPA